MLLERVRASGPHAALLLPFILLAILLLLAPLGLFLSFAFRDSAQLWTETISNASNVRTVGRTIAISLQVTAICAALAYVYVRGMLISGSRVRSLLLYAVLVPFFTSILVRTYAWIVILSNNGPIAAIGRSLTGSAVTYDLLYNRIGVLIGMVHVLLPLFILPLYAVARRIPDRLNPAARTLGASRIEAFLAVDLPLSLPGAAAGAVLVFITALGFYITPALLGGTQDVMVAQAIDREFAASGELSIAAALSALLVVIVLLALLLLRTVFPLEVLFLPQRVEYQRSRKAGPHRRSNAMERVLSLLRSNVLRALNVLPWRMLTRAGTWLIVAFFLIPLAIVVPVAFSGDAFLQFPPSSYSMRWYTTVWQDPLWRSATVNSLTIGAMSVVFAGAVGVPVAFSLARGRYSSRIKASVLLVAVLPLMVPIMVLAVSIFVWFLELGLIGSRPAMAAAHALLGVPFVVVIVSASLRDFDIRLEKAARTLGAGPIRALLHVTLRIIMPAIASGLLFAFLASFDELLIANGVARLETETLPIRLWNGAREEISPALAVVSTLSIVLTTTLLAIASWAGRIRRRQIVRS
jgi:putative spermidine/putrescine transport system permease protein